MYGGDDDDDNVLLFRVPLSMVSPAMTVHRACDPDFAYPGARIYICPHSSVQVHVLLWDCADGAAAVPDPGKRAAAVHGPGGATAGTAAVPDPDDTAALIFSAVLQVLLLQFLWLALDRTRSRVLPHMCQPSAASTLTYPSSDGGHG